MFDAGSNVEFMQIQEKLSNADKTDQLQLEERITAQGKVKGNAIKGSETEYNNKPLSISHFLPDSVYKEKTLDMAVVQVISSECREDKTNGNIITHSNNELSDNFTEIDISSLKYHDRLYRIYPTKTDKLAIENTNSKTFFGKLKEIEHCDDGKLRVVFSLNQSNQNTLGNMEISKIERLCK